MEIFMKKESHCILSQSLKVPNICIEVCQMKLTIIENMVLNLVKKMLVYLNISFWAARKYDRKISQEIENQYNADDAGRYNKILIAKEHLANIQKIISAARTFHYENTLPWSDNGGRLLPSTNYFAYVKAIQCYKDDFEREVSNFIRVYPR